MSVTRLSVTHLSPEMKAAVKAELSKYMGTIGGFPPTVRVVVADQTLIWHISDGLKGAAIMTTDRDPGDEDVDR